MADRGGRIVKVYKEEQSRRCELVTRGSGSAVERRICDYTIYARTSLVGYYL